MTLQEALGKIADPEVRQFFEEMTKNQNSYITKLETQLKDLQAKGPGQAPQPQAGGDDVTKKYILRKMRDDVIAEAKAAIVSSYGEDVYAAVAKEYGEFLEKNMSVERTNKEYAIDAFNLVFGRCMADKSHPIHQAIGKGAANPGATPNPPAAAGTNGNQVAAVQNVIAGQPTVMTGDDQGAGRGLPGTQGTPVKDTRDAFARLKERTQKAGSGKFQ